MSTKLQSFEELEAYKACREFRIFLSKQVYRVLNEAKEFDLLNQLKRSARSTTANIAEGFGRYHYLDNSKFCTISRGSLCESLDHLNSAIDEGILSEELYTSARELYETAIKILNGYIAYLYRSANDSKK